MCNKTNMFFLFCLSLVVLPAFAKNVNSLQDIVVNRSKEQRLVKLKTSAKPVYSALRFDDAKGLRVVIDIADSILTELKMPDITSDGFITCISAEQLENGTKQLVRVTIYFAQPVVYETGVEDNAIVIKAKIQQPNIQIGDLLKSGKKEKQVAANTNTKFLSSLSILKDVKVLKTANTILLSLSNIPEYEVLHLSDPQRLVIDLKNTKSLLNTVQQQGNAWFKKIRLGLYPDKARIVFDLQNQNITHTITPSKQGLLLALKQQDLPQAAPPEVAPQDPKLPPPPPPPGVAPPPPPSVTPLPAPTLPETQLSVSAVLKDIRFSVEDDNTAVVEIDLAGDHEKVKTNIDSRSKKSWSLEIHNVSLPKNLEKTTDTSSYGSVVRMLSAYQGKQLDGSPMTRLVVNLKGPATSQLIESDTTLRWEIRGKNKGQKEPKVPEGVEIMRDPITGGALLDKKRINIDLKDAEIVNVIRFLSEVSGENIITGDDIRGKVTLKLRNVPWDKALDTILRAKGYDKVTQNNILRIAPSDILQKEREAELAKRQAEEKVEETIIKIININYALASDIVTQVKPLLSARGSVQTDTRTNTIIVEDVRSNIQRLAELTKRLDRQTPQVLIEARIVEASSSFLQEVGIQWGGTGQATSRNGNPTGLAFPSDVIVSGGADDATRNITVGSGTPGRYAINLPASVGAGAGGALGFQFGSVNGSAILNLRLSAMEESGSGRIISSPRITTLDNKTARISQGVDIPITVVSAAGANTRFIPARLELEVTPHVTNDGSVMMQIRTEKAEPDFARTGAAGDPSIQKKSAETQVLVFDGETTVIGGIYTRNTSDKTVGVPVLSRIPILGFLFRNHREEDVRAELLVFITPRIVNRQQALTPQDTEGTTLFRGAH